MKTVIVFAHEVIGSGGFLWWPEGRANRRQARELYDKEPSCWGGDPLWRRLAKVEVPENLTGDEVTEYVDDVLYNTGKGLTILAEDKTEDYDREDERYHLGIA